MPIECTTYIPTTNSTSGFAASPSRATAAATTASLSRADCVTKSKPGENQCSGLVVSAHGRHYVVEIAGGELLHCYPRGKRGKIACGDQLTIQRSGDQQGAIIDVEPRSSLLYRSDRHRQKMIAANIDQAVVVVAAKPAFHEELLMRCLVACEQQHIKALIVLNKTDLIEETTATARKLALYESLGYKVVPLSAKHDVTPLLRPLRGHRNVVVGQSGMGKSTIVNALVPNAKARTAEFSAKLDSGKHTTSGARLYHLDADTSIIDSPGMQTFGLRHLSPPDFVNGFPEFLPFLGRCRFDDCSHTVEPGCAIATAVERTEIDATRWNAYRMLMKELETRPPEWA
jgi:ribosome biogenesis GTPase